MENQIGLPLLSFTGGVAQGPDGNSRSGVGRWVREFEAGRRAREIEGGRRAREIEDGRRAIEIEAGRRAREIEAGPAKCLLSVCTRLVPLPFTSNFS